MPLLVTKLMGTRRATASAAPARIETKRRSTRAYNACHDSQGSGFHQGRAGGSSFAVAAPGPGAFGASGSDVASEGNAPTLPQSCLKITRIGPEKMKSGKMRSSVE